MRLAEYLLEQNTTLLGTMNRQRRELPPSARGKDALYDTRLMKSSDATLTIYQSKPHKNVCVLSTMHTGITIESQLPKKKPSSVIDYNKTKCGVDIMDQMARKYSVKTATRRWPVAVFYNMLDLAAINAYVLFKQCNNTPRLERRDFLERLGKQLCKEHIEQRASAVGIPLPRTPRRPVLQPLPVTPATPATPDNTAEGTPPARKRQTRTPRSDTETPTKKRRQCQLNRCGNKTTDACHKCGIRACGGCAGAFTMTCPKCL